MKRRQILNIDAYPLAWPEGWQRTQPNRRKHSRYQVSFARARDTVVQEVRLLKADDVVVSTNVPTKRNGMPYAVGQAEPTDPGVAVYWINGKGSRVIACDAWRTVRENLRAVGLAVAGLRQIERTKATEILERAFQGFAALPAGIGWREVFGFAPDAVVNAVTLELRYRELTLQRHPDRGGSHDDMAKLNLAYREAKEDLS